MLVSYLLCLRPGAMCSGYNGEQIQRCYLIPPRGYGKYIRSAL